jgi:hypothetical protein
MKLHEALEQSKHGDAVKDVENGAYTVSKANLSAGYYKDFHPSDPARRSPVSTSTYYGYDYPGANPLATLAEYYGEDGWKPGR